MRKIVAEVALVLVAGAPLGLLRIEAALVRKAPARAVVSGAQAANPLAELMSAARTIGERPVWENAYVRVHYVVLEYPAAERRVAESRPVVLFVRVETGRRSDAPRLLEAPEQTRPLWRTGVVPCGVRIEVLARPPASSALGEPGTDPPNGAIAEDHEDYELVLVAFRPQVHGAGTGRLPSVTIFLSEGVVDISNRGVRRRMGVQAGDAFWFEAFTRLTVIDDYPVAAAIVQLRPR